MDCPNYVPLNAERVACRILKRHDHNRYHNAGLDRNRHQRRLARAWSLVLTTSCGNRRIAESSAMPRAFRAMVGASSAGSLMSEPAKPIPGDLAEAFCAAVLSYPDGDFGSSEPTVGFRGHQHHLRDGRAFQKRSNTRKYICAFM